MDLATPFNPTMLHYASNRFPVSDMRTVIAENEEDTIEEPESIDTHNDRGPSSRQSVDDEQFWETLTINDIQESNAQDDLIAESEATNKHEQTKRFSVLYNFPDPASLRGPCQPGVSPHSSPLRIKSSKKKSSRKANRRSQASKRVVIQDADLQNFGPHDQGGDITRASSKMDKVVTSKSADT